MPRRYYLILLLATLAGAWLRLWQLTAVPPGLHYDLAATALLGNQIAFEGARPIFIQAFTGHEVLFYYWLAVWFQLIGSSVFSLRLAAAMLGVLTIPAGFFAVRQFMRLLTPPDKTLQFTVAALAAVLLSFAFFHVTFSRFGFRVITQPLVQCLAIGFLCRGVAMLQFSNSQKKKTGELVDFALAGLFTGLAAYTYLSARLFPFPLGVFWLALFFGAWLSRSPFHVSRSTFYISRFTLYFASAALTFAPLGLHFLQHPEDFLNRFSQVAPRAGEENLLWQGVRRALEMVFINGETYDRYNLPSLPLLVMPLGIFFVIGLGVILFTLTRSSAHPFSRPAQILLLVWLPFMLLPTALAVNEIYPSTIRAFGVTPLLFVFPAYGLALAFRWLQKQWPGPLLPTAYPMTWLTLAILALGVAATNRLYFERWANLPSQRLNNETDMTGLAEYLNTRSIESLTPAATSIHYRHPTVAYLARDFNAVQWLTGGNALVLPASGGLLVLNAASAPLPKEWTAGWEPYQVHQQLGWDNAPELTVYEFPAGQTPPLPGFKPLEENFSNVIFATGFRATSAEGVLTVDVRWRIENPAPAEDFLPYVRVYDAAGRVWAQSANYTFPSQQWRAGDVLITRHRIEMPPGLPLANYVLKVGLYSESTQTNLNRLTVQGGFGGQRAVLGSVHLQNTNASAADLSRSFSISSVSGGPLFFLGYQLPGGAVRQNQRFELTLFWHSATPRSVPLKIFLGDEILWAGEVSVAGVLAQKLTLRVPAETPAGQNLLKLQLGADVFELAPLDVTAVTRSFNLPPEATRAAVDLEDKVRLAGYELTPGRVTRLKLYWQALAPMETDYTVFVHVLEASGQILRQADSQPQAGAYPTSMWLAREVVADEYAFELPPGNYLLAVGLYEAETGQRLSTLNGNRVEIGPFSVP